MNLLITLGLLLRQIRPVKMKKTYIPLYSQIRNYRRDGSESFGWTTPGVAGISTFVGALLAINGVIEKENTRKNWR